MTHGYRIAGRMSQADLTRIDTGSHFARCIGDVFRRFRPRRIVETGTYLGTGTTLVIAGAIRELGLDHAVFHSIEVNPKHAARARENLSRAGFDVSILHGHRSPVRTVPDRAGRHSPREALPQLSGAAGRRPIRSARRVGGEIRLLHRTVQPLKCDV